jgi:hypothetical protein
VKKADHSSYVWRPLTPQQLLECDLLARRENEAEEAKRNLGSG